MKQFVGLIKRMAIVAVALLMAASVQAQGDAEWKTQGLDTRIWSQSYWYQMARLGFVEVAPDVPPQKAVYTTSRIEAPGVLTEDSPDVPVTTITNTTQSENSVFVDPLDNNTVLNSNNSTDWPVSTLYGADALYTTDGGATWGGQITGAGGTNSGDPATAIGRNGWWYVGYVAADYGQGVAYSTNGGATWTHVQVASVWWELLDKNHLWIDNSLSSPYEGYLYSAWTNFYGTNDGDIELSRSTTDGLSWSSAINISSAVGAGSHNQGVNIQTGPNGEVYAVWSIYDSWPSDETAIGFAKSTNGGASFAPATRIITNIRGIRTTQTSKDMRVNSFPVMAVDISGGPNDGTLYVVWANIGVPGINVGPDIDVYMIKSTNGGSSWSMPVKVNQDPSGLGKEHYFPWINCDPETGDLHVIFYDDRNVSSTDCETFVATSTDGGATWTDFKVSDVSFTPSPIPGLAEGYFGDYLGISARGGKAYPAWTDNRDGRAMTYVSPYVMEEDTIPPQAIDDLTITLAAADLMLEWSSVTTDTSGNPLVVDLYRIYRDTVAYFEPGSEPFDSTVALSYVDDSGAVGDTLTHHYYLVTAVASGNESEPSGEVGEFDKYLQVGYNLVSWPFIIHDTPIQSVFADSMGTGCQLTGGYPAANSDQVKYFDCSTGTWYTAWYKIGGPGASYVWKGNLTTVESDKGYWIIIQDDHPAVTLTMTGAVSDTNRIVPICPGPSYNYVGTCWPVYRPLGGTTGDDCNLVGSGFTGGYPAANSDKVRYFDGFTWYTAWYKVGGPGGDGWQGQLSAAQTPNDPTLEPGNGYILDVLGDFINDQWVYPPPPAK